jgi:hypothetical protein
MVYVTQAYPGLKPYLKGFHLLLEMWQGDRDKEGWKCKGPPKGAEGDRDPILEPPALRSEEEPSLEPAVAHMEEGKINIFIQSMTRDPPRKAEPPDGLTPPAPRFKEDPEAILFLAISAQPVMRCVHNN